MFNFMKKKQDEIRYQGPVDALAWKYEDAKLTKDTKLRVGMNQSAFIFLDGILFDRYEYGEVMLTTQNMPLWKKMLSSKSQNIDTADIYFVNTGVSTRLDWKTDEPIVMMDPEYDLEINIRAFGDLVISVRDPEQFLRKFATISRDFSQEGITRFLSGEMTMHIIDCIVNTLQDEHIGGNYINAHLLKFAEKIKGRLQRIMGEYGMQLEHFTLRSVKVSGLESIKNVIKGNKIDIVEAVGKNDVARLKSDLNRIGIDDERYRIDELERAKTNAYLERGLAEARIMEAKAKSGYRDPEENQDPMTEEFKKIEKLLAQKLISPEDAEKMRKRLIKKWM